MICQRHPTQEEKRLSRSSGRFTHRLRRLHETEIKIIVCLKYRKNDIIISWFSAVGRAELRAVPLGPASCRRSRVAADQRPIFSVGFGPRCEFTAELKLLKA